MFEVKCYLPENQKSDTTAKRQKKRHNTKIDYFPTTHKHVISSDIKVRSIQIARNAEHIYDAMGFPYEITSTFVRSLFP